MHLLVLPVCPARGSDCAAMLGGVLGFPRRGRSRSRSGSDSSSSGRKAGSKKFNKKAGRAGWGAGGAGELAGPKA